MEDVPSRLVELQAYFPNIIHVLSVFGYVDSLLYHARSFALSIFIVFFNPSPLSTLLQF
jgi:hypothetical protein